LTTLAVYSVNRDSDRSRICPSVYLFVVFDHQVNHFLLAAGGLAIALRDQQSERSSTAIAPAAADHRLADI
jgi:hypothetical protein